MVFIKTVENFTCEHCGEHVAGTGYTNHCPACLWSKHVDIDPGDRKATCGGLMEPVALEGSTPNYVLTQKCVRCGFERRNRVDEQDSPASIVALAGKRRDAQ